MTYAVLTTADKGALLDAKKNGALWIARDEDGAICGHQEKPEKSYSKGFYGNHWKTSFPFLKVVGFEIDQYCDLKFVQWSDDEPVNIDLALAQIEEMERETKACSFCSGMTIMSGNFSGSGALPNGNRAEMYTEDSPDFNFCPMCARPLNVPYTEGETK